MESPSDYDPVTLNHWLWWKLRCSEATGAEFQRLFEETMVRTDPDFARIRAYGNVGDRKADGILVGGDAVYQVYSPDEYKQRELAKKIDDDLDGAVRQWPRLRRWVFVYNVRRGLAPDVAQQLQRGKERHPGILLEHWSSDYLWELLRGLDVQKRSEVLGPPLGHGQHSLSSGSLARRAFGNLRVVLLHDMLSPIDEVGVASTLHGTEVESAGPPLRIRPTLDDGWESAARVQSELVASAVELSRGLCSQFAVFCMSPVPLAVHLGYLLSNRVSVEVFQWNRDAGSWRWGAGRSGGVAVMGIPDGEVSCEHVRIRVSVSSAIRIDDCPPVRESEPLDVEVRVDEPDEGWLQRPEQVQAVGAAFRDVLSALRARAPRLCHVHLFAAVPAGIAVELGRSINPRTNPPIVLYEYDRNKQPQYWRVLTLGG